MPALGTVAFLLVLTAMEKLSALNAVEQKAIAVPLEELAITPVVPEPEKAK